MNAPALTRGELAAALIVDGALRIIAGNPQGKLPVEPVVLNGEEKKKLGLEPGRFALFYPAEEDGVFFELGGATATAWFNRGDCSKALAQFEAALKRVYPQARQVEDSVHPANRDLRSRVYEVDLGAGKLAAVEAAYPVSGRKGPQFAVRVHAKQRGAQ